MRTSIILMILILFVTSCKNDTPINENQDTSNTLNECFITQFEFKAIDNPEILINDLTADIQDSTITIHIPHIVDNKILKPSISYIGDTISFEGYKDEYIDFSKPTKCIVSNNNGNKKHIR